MFARNSTFHLALFVLLFIASSRALALNAFLKPEQVYDGDIAVLILQYENDIPSLYALDTTPLEQAFEVIDAQSRIHRINDPAKPGLLMEWVVLIAPRSSGSIEVPPLRLGQHISAPLSLKVMPRSEQNRRENDVSLEMEVSSTHPYVGQQVIVTMRLLSNVELANVRITEPETGQGRVYSNRKDHHYTITKQGRQYQVLERSFSLFADETGFLQLGSASFRGRLPDTRGRMVLRKSEAIELQIRPKPIELVNETWLAAENLVLRQRWDSLDGPLEIGQSLGFTLDIVARGLASEALPIDLASQDNPDFRIYPDEAKTSDEFDGDSIVGRMRQSFVFVASRPGTIDVPAISLRWWDTNSSSLREAILPGRQIESIDPATTPMAPLSENKEFSGINADRNSGIPIWIFVALLLLAGVLLPTGNKSLAQRLISRIRRHRVIHTCETSFKQACLANNPVLARERLIQLAHYCWPGERCYGLQFIADTMANDKFSIELSRLDAAVFSKGVNTWEGGKLWQAFAKCRQGRANTRFEASSSLPRLYPTGFRRRLYSSP